jgi:hypothetical protein
MRTTRQLADTLTALDVDTAVCGRSVRAWLPSHQDSAILVMPRWMTDRRHPALRRRVWWWQRGNSSGWRARADTHGAAEAVAALLHCQR